MYTNMKRLRFLFFLTALLLPLSLCARAQEQQEQDVQEERELLAKAIYACTGQVSFCREWRLCIGELLLNRVASPEFPDTLEEVLRSMPYLAEAKKPLPFRLKKAMLAKDSWPIRNGSLRE